MAWEGQRQHSAAAATAATAGTGELSSSCVATIILQLRVLCSSSLRFCLRTTKLPFTDTAAVVTTDALFSRPQLE
jgi:hypothetical protein